MIAGINIVACTIFASITTFEAQQTVNDETYSSFFKILIMQFINISIIILLVNFNLSSSSSDNTISDDPTPP